MITSRNFSVVVPSYNSSKTIEACLNSLYAQTAQPLEIIVADSSDDRTPEIIQEKYPQVKLVHFQERTFPGPARNRGAEITVGDIIAFIDSDCIADKKWLELMAKEHNCGHLIVGGAIEVGNPKSALAWAGHLGEFRDYLPHGEARYMMHIPTCNISYRRSMFIRGGGFPNAYYPQEDLLFNYMLNKHGYQVWFNPEIRIRHFCREDLRSYLSHQHRIGRVTRCTLSKINLEGSRVARHGLVAWLASPFLGLLKYVRTSNIFYQRHWRVLRQHPSLPLLLLFGSIWWARGFAAGARIGLSGIRGWNDPHESIFQEIEQNWIEHHFEAPLETSDKAHG